MDLTIVVWRQKGPAARGQMVSYDAPDISPDCSFLEMLDILNERLIAKGEEPIAMDHDCREGICGMCGLVINGIPHGPRSATTTCQLHMREFEKRGIRKITIEPWRARGFPILRDLIVDRSAFDRIMQAGGFISVHTGSAPDGNAIPISKEKADTSMDAASCIGCAACVAACPNASAMLYVGAKISQFANLPQGQPERNTRALNMVRQMEQEGFGGCTNHRECEAACPKEIKIEHIGQMNRDFLKACIVGNG